jgi:hypothetical protein
MSNLLLISVARKGDGIIVADKSPPRAPKAVDMIRENVKKVTSSTKLRNGKSTRHSLDDEVAGLSVKYNILIHSSLVLVVVTAEDYERRIAFQLLEKLAAEFDQSGALMGAVAASSEYGMRRQGECSKLIAGLLKEFEDPTNVDTMARVTAQIEATKGALGTAIAGIMVNVKMAEDIEVDANKLRDNTDGFKTGAKKASCMQQKRGIVLTLTIVGVVALVVVILVVLVILVIVINVCKGDACTSDEEKKLLLRMLRM